MNTHVRDNLNALKTPAGGYNKLDLGADITSSSTTFADVDSTNLAFTFTTGGGDVLIGFTGVVQASVSARTYFDIHESVAGTRFGGDDGLYEVPFSTTSTQVSFTVRITGLSAASHTFKLQWKMSAASTNTLFAGAGTSAHDLHPNFWAVEL